jgi:hypothetical protein
MLEQPIRSMAQRFKGHSGDVAMAICMSLTAEWLGDGRSQQAQSSN